MKQQPTFVSYLESQRRLQSQLGRQRRAEILRSAINKLKRFRKNRDIPFARLNSALMQAFEASMQAENLSRNTIGFYMRTLRAYYNMAVEEGFTADLQPFRRVYKGKDKTVKRALTIDDVRRIKLLDLSSRPRFEFARDMLLFSFYARGMAFVDMAYLRKSDLRGDHFVYRRHKTGQTLCVEWVEPMQRILEKWSSPDTPYLLPIITSTDKDPRRQYLTRSQTITRHLKVVGSLAELASPLTLYRARHSWASLARSQNIPIAVISAALGHDSERTTEIYLSSIQTSVVDQANRQLIENL